VPASIPEKVWTVAAFESKGRALLKNRPIGKRFVSILACRGKTHMDADDLRIVDAVARIGSMNRAAAELNMVQSNVTSRIRLLEEELGVQLFVRHSRGVEPSEAGLRLLSYVEQIRALFQQAITAVKEDGTPKGKLRIGMLETAAGLRLPTLVAQYAQEYPRVELAIMTGTTTSLIDQVTENELDGAFVAGPVHHQELSEEPLFLEDLVLVTPLSVRNFDDLAKVENLKAIVFRQGCSYRQRLGSILDGLRIRYVVMEFASLDAIITCITAGVGITLLPKALVDKLWTDQSVTVHELPVDQAQVETVFVRRHDRNPTSALNAFMRMSRQISNIATLDRQLEAID
jgi:LysR family transcriptional regulator, cell division regulator